MELSKTRVEFTILLKKIKIVPFILSQRLDYQKNESLISSEIANDRIKKLDKYIEKIMNEVMNKHEEENTIKAIREYFQNHATKFELKI